MLGYSHADFMGYCGGEALYMCRSMSLGAEYCCTLAAWLGLVVPHLEQPGCISSFVSGLLSKGEKVQRRMLYFQVLSQKAAGRQSRHSPIEAQWSSPSHCVGTASMSSALLCALGTVLDTMPGILHRSAVR